MKKENNHLLKIGKLRLIVHAKMGVTDFLISREHLAKLLASHALEILKPALANLPLKCRAKKNRSVKKTSKIQDR